MREFYEKHKNDLYAVFLVFGTKQNDGEVGDIRQSVLCNQASLETTQKEFIGFTSTTIYSLHKSSTTTIRNLLNTDLSGKYVQPAATCHNRLGIISPLALEAVRTWNKRNPKAVYSDYVIPEFMSQADKTERPIAKSIIVKSDQHSLKDAFAVAIKQNEKIKQMETESNEQGGMKRLLEGVSFVDPHKLIFSFLVD